MDDFDFLFANNRAWARRMVDDDPGYFSRLALQQAPRYLWIGCSDSRVPANQIIGLAPGEVFVHRNVANLVVFTDLNCLSVIHYAVEVLRVEHVMVVGHYGCGGVQAVLDHRQFGLVDSWLHHVEDLMHTHWRRLGAVEDPVERSDRLCEINVIEQLQHVGRLPMIEEAWRRGQKLVLHGMIYGIRDGLLRELAPPIRGPIDTMAWRKAALRGVWARAGAREPVRESGGVHEPGCGHDHGHVLAEAPAPAQAQATDDLRGRSPGNARSDPATPARSGASPRTGAAPRNGASPRKGAAPRQGAAPARPRARAGRGLEGD